MENRIKDLEEKIERLEKFIIINNNKAITIKANDDSYIEIYRDYVRISSGNIVIDAKESVSVKGTKNALLVCDNYIGIEALKELEILEKGKKY